MTNRRKTITARTLCAERLLRQGLAIPLQSPDAYVSLFRRLQPVATSWNSRPGSPPRLFDRTLFDDGVAAERLRAKQQLIKGRFLGNTVTYVYKDDLRLYANGCRVPLRAFDPEDLRVFEALQHCGPMTAAQVREETGLDRNRAGRALQRLQRAFLVLEDQVDGDWDTGWHVLSDAHPEVDTEDARRDADATEVVAIFLRSMLGATMQMIRDWSGFSTARVRRLMHAAASAGKFVQVEVDEGDAIWIDADDSVQDYHPAQTARKSTLVIHRNDGIARAFLSSLKKKYTGRKVLHYLMVDGELRGTVEGEWGISDYDVEDIRVDLPADQCAERRDDILRAVAQRYPLPKHRILRFCGKALSSREQETFGFL